MSRPSGDSIADCVLKTFEALPAKCKPRIQEKGRREWVPLAGIVLSKDHDNTQSLTCAALATGMKCLPQNKIGLANGNILHDSHAEILAIRSFNRFLLDECAELAKKGFGNDHTSAWIKWRTQGEGHAQHHPPFALQEDVKIHMYTSQTPCGDASMELTMSSQEDSTPWAVRQEGEMLGRGNFDQLGVVRRKPARPDAPQTLSKSCSDKLAMKECTGLLTGVVSTLIDVGGTWLSTLVVPEEEWRMCKAGMERAWGTDGRMAPLASKEVHERWQRHGYRFRPFEIQTTTRNFTFAKPVTPDPNVLHSNLSTLWTPRRQETIINGVLQGRKQLDPKGASCVSRKLLWKTALDVALLVGVAVLGKRTYAEMKGSYELRARESIKKDVKELALKPWVRNEGDEDFALETASKHE
ncbi:tRNA-specific adenosine deaminase 1 [Pseudocercospora fuligena]|uniref:tRNA-specific adenosine deaminase 1 n=1 Tax=Pseudocercospora fuligena TaxID=685502 RepID=A0A8H6R720_9PEZI|nr:tRNA-specific adenosine deaminase 1 [Pseudocercospora fuligena]